MDNEPEQRDPDFGFLVSNSAESAIKNLEYSQANISGHKVSAALVSTFPESVYSKDSGLSSKYKMFLGANIELSHSKVYHAEEVALIKSISEGYTIPLTVTVTSNSEEQLAALCGYCRQTYMYINPQTRIFVVDMDSNVRLDVVLIDTMRFPYLAKYPLSPVIPKI